jgi:mannose-6-phosphate isomerase-like protein (cupin superfamily)
MANVLGRHPDMLYAPIEVKGDAGKWQYGPIQQFKTAKKTKAVVLYEATDKHPAQVKEVVAKLKSRRRAEAEVHRKVYRPWGHFDLLHAGPGFLVKSLVVKPGGALSLQRHRRRAEHWVVVRGTAKVTRGDEQLELHANQSTYIPLGVMHRLENPGPEQLEIVEVQSGDYLGEDDIERFDDRYGRS